MGELTPYNEGFMGQFTYSPDDYPSIEDAKKAFAKKHNIEDPSSLQVLDTKYNPNPEIPG